MAFNNVTIDWFFALTLVRAYAMCLARISYVCLSRVLNLSWSRVCDAFRLYLIYYFISAPRERFFPSCFTGFILIFMRFRQIPSDGVVSRVVSTVAVGVYSKVVPVPSR